MRVRVGVVRERPGLLVEKQVVQDEVLVRLAPLSPHPHPVHYPDHQGAICRFKD